ncbi:hypothetical protein K0U83_12120 [bacterium]|nr:hypothetical protein [bacterium]
MAYHISQTELETALGSNAVSGLADADTDTIDDLIEYGSALVDSALLNAGYTPPETTKADPSGAVKLLKMATVGAVVGLLWGRKGLKAPEGLNVFGATFNELYSGNLKIPGMDPSAADGVGGVDFSSSSTTDPDGRPQVFGVLRKVY